MICYQQGAAAMRPFLHGRAALLGRRPVLCGGQGAVAVVAGAAVALSDPVAGFLCSIFEKYLFDALFCPKQSV